MSTLLLATLWQTVENLRPPRIANDYDAGWDQALTQVQCYLEDKIESGKVAGTQAERENHPDSMENPPS